MKSGKNSKKRIAKMIDSPTLGTQHWGANIKALCRLFYYQAALTELPCTLQIHLSSTPDRQIHRHAEGAFIRIGHRDAPVMQFRN